MDKIIERFSVQNILRQFFCGVVFFVPIILFCEESLLVEKTGVLGGLWLLLAPIIGTVIYHLEKNFYSYPLQLLWEWLGEKTWKCIMGGIGLVIAVRFCGVSEIALPNPMWILAGIVVLCFIMGLVLLMVSEEIIVKHTLLFWKLESDVDGGDTQTRACLQKIGLWSDFIHCVQSNCFAWLIGSSYVYKIVPSVWNKEELFRWGVCAALILLVLEMLVDAHRYRFVRELVYNKKSTRDKNNIQE